MDTSDEEIMEGGLDRDYIDLGSDMEIVPEGGAADEGDNEAGAAAAQVEREYGLILESLGVTEDKLVDGKMQVFEWPGTSQSQVSRYVFPTLPPLF